MRFPRVSYAAINWSPSHTTLVSANTRGRRSKRNRRALRAARAGDLDTAQRILFAPLDLPPLYMSTADEFQHVHRIVGHAEPELHFR
jgi:hypothetical protein